MLINRISFNPYTRNNFNIQSKNVSNPSTGVKNSGTLSFGSSAEYEDSLSIAAAFMAQYYGILDIYRKEHTFSDFVKSIISTPKILRTIDKQGYMKTDDMIDFVYSEEPGSADFLKTLLKENGINSFMSLSVFLNNFENGSDTGQVFSGQMIEALEIFSKLKTKSDLSAYPQLLLNAYYNHLTETPDKKFDPNTITEQLKSHGVKNMSEFDKKLGYLAPKFNNFDTTEDKQNAIAYLGKTKENKLQLIDEIFSNSKTDSNKIYYAHHDVINYLYEQNSGESLKPFSEIYDSLRELKNIKQNSPILEDFNGLATPEDKIEFCEFLKDCEVKVKDITELSGKSPVEGNDPITNIINKKVIIKEIQTIKKIDETAASADYYKSADFYNALYKTGKHGKNLLRNFIALTSKYELKNSASAVAFFNTMYGTKKKTITPAEIKELTLLVEYDTSKGKDIIKKAKSEKIPPAELLKRDKEGFDKVKDIITDFLVFDESDWFLGKKSIEIYKEYKDLIDKAPEETALILQNAITLGVVNSEEYAEKTKLIGRLENYFKSSSDLSNFIQRNDIKFDSSKEDTEYINNCIEILKIASESDNPKVAEKLIPFYTKSEFFANSKNDLSEFLSKYPKEKEKREILETIALKRIPSVTDYENMLKKYTCKNRSEADIISVLRELPDEIDFGTFLNILDRIDLKLSHTNFGANFDDIKLTPDLTVRYSSKERLKAENDVAFLTKSFDIAPDENILSLLPGTYKAERKTHSKMNMAFETVNRAESGGESYKEILRLTKTDKTSLGINDDCGTYIQARAVEENIPDEFAELINSMDLITLNNGKRPSLSLHAKMRLLDRFILKDCKTIEEACSPGTKQKAAAILNKVYSATPAELLPSYNSNGITLYTRNGQEYIKTVFSKEGTMITIMPSDGKDIIRK